MSFATSTIRSAWSRANCCLTVALSLNAWRTRSRMYGNSRRGPPCCQTPPVSSIVSGFGRSSWSGLSNGVHGHGDHRSDVRDTGRQNERVVGLGQLTEFGDVLFGDPQLNRLLASGDLNGLGDLSQALGCGLGDGKDCGSGTLGFIDLLLFLGFRGLNHLLLLTFGLVDHRVAFAFGGEDQRAFFTLRAHLFLHRVEHAL